MSDTVEDWSTASFTMKERGSWVVRLAMRDFSPQVDDLAAYAQMMMDEGFYGGRRYFSRSIIEEFTRKQEMPTGSDRALGWDTRAKEGSWSGDYFSESSFGHTGFTWYFHVDRSCPSNRRDPLFQQSTSYTRKREE
jgi:hypothetical protein